MAKEICISVTPHETRLAILEDDQLAEIYYERENEYTLAGSIYKGKVTRVLPGMQSSFVDLGLERDAFLYVTDFLEDSEDSDEYETSSTGGAPRRGGERGGERAPERNAERTPDREEPRAAQEPAAAGEERRGRRDGRREGGRGEARRNERKPAEAVSIEAVPERAAEPAPRMRASEERAQAAAALRAAQPTEDDRDSKGDDDSPEGTRRWRGRRGRRRGGMRAGVLGAEPARRPAAGAEQSPETPTVSLDAVPFSLPERGAPGGIATSLGTDEEDTTLDLQASAAIAMAQDTAPTPSDRPERTRDRDRRGGRRGREGAAERDFTPAVPFVTSEQTIAEPPVRVASSALAGPVLPGESLSKYGGAPADTATPAPQAKLALPQRPVNYTPPKPSTLVELGEGWDGGSVLPGESLSRYQAAAAPSRSTSSFVTEQAAHAPASIEASAAQENHTAEASSQESLPDGLNQVASESAAASVLESDIHTTQRDQQIDAAIAEATTAPPEIVAEALPAATHAEDYVTTAQPIDEPAQTASAVAESAIAESESAVEPVSAHPVTEHPLVEHPLAEHPMADPAATAASLAENDEYEPQEGDAAARLAPPSTNELRLSRLFGGGEKPAPEEASEKEAPETIPPVALAEPEQERGATEQWNAPLAEESHLAAGTHEPAHAVVHEPEHSFRHEEDATRSTLEAGNEGIPEMTLDLNGEPGAYGGAEPSFEPAHTIDPAYASVDHSSHDAELARIEGALSPSFAGRFEDHSEAEATELSEAHELSPALHEESTHSSDHTRRSDGFTELVDQLQGFAPGMGLLEEEVIDEDEYDFEMLDATSDEHDLEDLEEETLDGHAHDEHHGEPDSEHDAEEQEPATRHAAESRHNTGHAQRAEFEEDEASAFSLEELEEGDEEEEAAPLATDGSPNRERTERGGEERARRSGRNAGRRRGGPGSGGGGGRRQSAQTQDLPIISDLLKQGQEILVQIAKEPIAKKGARITSHIALPGRFLVFMPTVSHVGVSRKISSDEERQRLKRILISEKGDFQGGFIVRTAADGASEEELRADLRFLINLWSEIKTRSETAKAPALIYHDLNLVERILRDQVSSNFSTIWVDTEQEYERIVRFLNRFQPSLVRRVKLYTKETPLFEHFGIQEEISKALKSKVWLKSGGSIVINQTEALVAIDINTGKYVGKTARLEDTIVKTNLDAIPEIVRQIRLRDLGGIIVIDFIDMDERKNRHKVLAALEEAMKVDRAPSKVLQFNDFGLVAITRKRVKQSLERTLSVTCETCAGTGMVKSPITVCNEIFIELRKMQKHLDGKDVMLRVNPEVVKQLKSGNGRWINEYEEMVGKTIIIKSDPSLHPEQFDIH